MKLTLYYDGELRASGNKPKPADKHHIRSLLHPQLLEFCTVHPELRHALSETKIPFGYEFWGIHRHHDDPSPATPLDEPLMDLCAPIEVGQHKFIPLIRGSLALTCKLKILFLRKEEPGSLVFQGGDIDNRIKTLFDALRMPTADELPANVEYENPTYCLLESDALITGCEINTDRLLSRPNAPASEVRLVIEVDIRVSRHRPYNSIYLAD